MKKSFLLACAIILTLTGWAQPINGKISGSVADAAGAPLPAVTVSLLRGKDSSLAKLGVTDKGGRFELPSVKEGAYLLAFSSVGYTRKLYGPVAFTGGEMELPKVLLDLASAREMATVTVVARRPPVEMKVDKMVVNVDASPTNAGNSALEVLEKSPGITLDRDGNISLRGKQGVIILIDGKPTYLGGQDLTNFLRNLSAAQLDQIEIMTQPSARYDASGNSGVINFRTKKNEARGMNGSINLSYVQGRYPKSPNSFNFNYRQGKVNLFSNVSYSFWEGFNDLDLSRGFRDRTTGVDTFTILQNTAMRFQSNNMNARVGMDYTLDKKTVIGFNLNGALSLREHRGYTLSNFYDGAGELVNINEARSTDNGPWKNLGVNLNFRKNFKKAGQELSADADYLRYSSRSNQQSHNYSFTAAKDPFGEPYLLRGSLPQNISIYSGKLDYTQPLAKEAKLELGAKSSYVTIDNQAPYYSFDHQAGADTVDARSDHFIYTENINAAYANYNRQLKKWGVQLGLRLEHTYSVGHSVKLGTKIPKNYAQLFPTTYLTYKLNAKNNLALSYGRRLERPNYRDLNPFQQLLDRYTFQQGNPYLTPQFTHNVEFSHNYAGRLNTSLNYTNTTDIINDIIKQVDSIKTSFQTKENIATRRNMGIAVSYNAPITKWWTTSVYVNAFNTRFKGFVNGATLDAAITSFSSNMSQQFRFAKTWNAEVNGFFRSRAQEGGIMIAQPMGVVSFGFGKQVLKGKGTVKLNITDPFRLQVFRGYTRFENINLGIRALNDTRRVGLNFSYRFSKGQNVQQRRKGGAPLEEQNRVGG